MDPGILDFLSQIAAEDWYISIGFAVLCGLVWGLWPQRHPDERRRWTYAWMLGVVSFAPLYLLVAYGFAIIEMQRTGGSWAAATGFVRETASMAQWLAIFLLLGTLFHAVVSLLPVMLSFELSWWFRRRWDARRESEEGANSRGG